MTPEAPCLLSDVPAEAFDDYVSALEGQAIVSITDARGVILSANERFCAISGFSREELVGRSHAIVNSGRHPPGFFRELWRTIARGEVWRGEICNRRKDGEAYWVDSIIFPILGDGRRPVRFVSIRHDVTAARRAQAEQADAATRLSAMADLAHVGFWTYQAGASGPVWDDKMRAIFAAPSDFAPTTAQAFDLYPPEARAQVAAACDACLGRGRPFDLELAFLTLEGEEGFGRLIGRAILAEGRVAGLTAVFQDLTERRARDVAAARLRARFEAIARAAPVAISVRDRMGTFHLANARYEALAGRGNLAGLSEEDLYPEPVAETLRAEDAAVLASGEPLTSEDVYPSGEGETVLLTSRFLIEDAVLRDKVVCAVGADITEQKRLHAELDAARAAAEAATRAKADFLSAVSHEIRTPMNGVIGMTETLLAGPLTPEQRHAAEVIRDGGAMLVGLVNDLLDYARVERAALTLESLPLDPAALARRALAVHERQAAAKGVDLRLTVGPGGAAARLGDPLRLQQILHNLVGNALKFTDRGGVSVALDADEAGALRLAVADTGIGMTPEQAARVFDSFAQADVTIARRFGGTGLGLAIVKGLAEAMGGSVAVASSPSLGSTFTVSLPLPLAPAAAERSTEPGPLFGGLRVLAADDNEINRAVLAALLDRLGAQATVVEGGRAAVAAARAARFDAILLDLSMPDLDGPEALALIRAEVEALGSTTPPAVAVTGRASAEDAAAVRAAGFAAHLAKPIDAERLAEVLARVVPPLSTERVHPIDG